jgi:hypothetical protein
MPYGRAIRRVQVGDDGRLWVLTDRASRDRPDNALGVFDVYTNGRLLEQITVKGDADPSHDRYYLFGSRFYVVTDYSSSSSTAKEQDEAEPMSIVCLQLEEVEAP